MYKTLKSTAIFVGLFTLFILSLLPIFYIEFVILLTIVVTLHELGHFVLMKLFGYKNVQMNFIPLLGAYVKGDYEEPNLFKNVVMLMAGPLPGLFLGYSLYLFDFVDYSDDVCWFAYLLITVNLLNLVPIEPLDGGKIARCSLFIRWKYLDVVIVYLSIIVVLTFICGVPQDLTTFLLSLLDFTVIGFILSGIAIYRWEYDYCYNQLYKFEFPKQEKQLSIEQRILISSVFNKCWLLKPPNQEVLDASDEEKQKVKNNIEGFLTKLVYKGTAAKFAYSLFIFYILCLFSGIGITSICSKAKEDCGAFPISFEKMSQKVRFRPK